LTDLGNPNSRYLAENSSYGKPFRYELTSRGFLSEVNNLLNASLYGIVKRRRLIVDQSKFGGLNWQALFGRDLPLAEGGSDLEIHAKFLSIRRWTALRDFARLPIRCKPLGMDGSLFDAKRAMAVALTLDIPSAPPISPYAAIHVRRGDKVEGYMVGKELRREGEATGLETYLSLIRAKMPEIRSIFVMTDDYRMVDALRQIAPELAIETLCPPDFVGYRQPDFSSLPVEVRTNYVRGLLAEIAVAARSTIFVGGYLSNVARYVALVHRDPAMCFSIDRQKKWLAS